MKDDEELEDGDVKEVRLEEVCDLKETVSSFRTWIYCMILVVVLFLPLLVGLALNYPDQSLRDITETDEASPQTILFLYEQEDVCWQSEKPEVNRTCYRPEEVKLQAAKRTSVIFKFQRASEPIYLFDNGQRIKEVRFIDFQNISSTEDILRQVQKEVYEVVEEGGYPR